MKSQMIIIMYRLMNGWMSSSNTHWFYLARESLTRRTTHSPQPQTPAFGTTQRRRCCKFTSAGSVSHTNSHLNELVLTNHPFSLCPPPQRRRNPLQHLPLVHERIPIRNRRQPTLRPPLPPQHRQPPPFPLPLNRKHEIHAPPNKSH